MTSEWTAEYVIGSVSDLTEVSSLCFCDGTKEKHEL